MLEQDGEVVGDRGRGGLPGRSGAAVAWAANTLGALGVTLEAGPRRHAGRPARVGAGRAGAVVHVPGSIGLGDVTVRFA